MLTWTLLGLVAGVLTLWKLFSGKKYKLSPELSGLLFFGNIYKLDPKSPHGTITKWSEQYGDVFKIKLYGHKVSHEDAERLIKATGKGQTVLSTAGPQMFLYAFPSLRYIMRGTYKTLVEAQQEVEEWFNFEIKSRRVEYEPGNPQCFLDAMFDQQKRCDEHQEGFRITNDNIYGINANLIFAGTVTTTISMQGLIAVLVNKPELQAKMVKMILDEIGDRASRLKDRTSLAYIEASILELLPYSSIIPLNLIHLTTVDTAINGFDIPKDTRSLNAAQRIGDTTRVPQPRSAYRWRQCNGCTPPAELEEGSPTTRRMRFNVSRLLLFGASRRVCFGEALPKNRLFLIITALLQHFEFLPEGPGLLPCHDPHDYVTGFGIMPKPHKVKLVMRQ